MATSIETLKLMDQGHAINTIRAEFDPLTSTPLEAFLLGQLEEAIDGQDTAITRAAENHDLEAGDIEALGDALIDSVATSAALLSLLWEADVTSKDELADVLAMLKALDNADIDSPATLEKHLNLSTEFHAIAADGAEAFARLSTLITTAHGGEA